MILSTLDVPLMMLLGVAAAVLHKYRLRDLNEDSFVFLNMLLPVVFWGYTGAVATQLMPALLPTEAVNSALLAAVYLLSYPLWFKWAGDLTFLLIGRNRQQGGLIWLLHLHDGTEENGPAWE